MTQILRVIYIPKTKFKPYNDTMDTNTIVNYLCSKTIKCFYKECSITCTFYFK